MIQKMRDFCKKMAFTATAITLLPPLLSPLNPNLMLYKPFPLLFSDFRFQFASLCTTNFWGF